ncbi:nucleotidyltransferase domain-containing protein [Roseomonas nepalensis]|uniref:Nucleotidyltransferase domain-containing protein n=1 Tax=Muricoccus nepalensis TaxID=1854500 RepID=A0A502FFI0_9PROT|nr:nucleotidyltransferase domain-containing protein [Roseomonas nepalensis]TPG48099.1 nucleotidyltransferase domain-containing protein [Roseomonas nepalensis]
MDLTQLQKAVSAWAATWPAIRAVWLTGSRAVGTYRPSSDVDLVIATAWLPMLGGEAVDLSGSARFTSQKGLRDEWTKELGIRLGLRAHIRTVGRLGSPEVDVPP